MLLAQHHPGHGHPIDSHPRKIKRRYFFFSLFVQCVLVNSTILLYPHYGYQLSYMGVGIPLRIDPVKTRQRARSVHHTPWIERILMAESELAELASFLEGVKHVEAGVLLGQLDLLGIMEPCDLGAYSGCHCHRIAASLVAVGAGVGGAATVRYGRPRSGTGVARVAVAAAVSAALMCCGCAAGALQ